MPVRVRAAVSLLIAADMDLDGTLALSTYEAIKVELDRCAPEDEARQRAELIYHAVFGDRREAMAVASMLLDRYPRPGFSQVAAKLRRNVVSALMRLGRFADAKSVIQADYEFMASKHVPRETVYRMILLGEISLYEGNPEEARLWVDRTGRLVAQDATYSSHIQSGYFSAAAELSLRDGRLNEAEAFADQAYQAYPSISTARYAAIDLSLRLRIQLARNGHPTAANIVSDLRALYALGAHLGAQDTIVEALWLADTMAGRTDDAGKLLRDYLLVCRREGRSTEGMLRSTTGADPIWSATDVPELCQR
jgi:tetratricopeptide (TPR) repeat protein